MRLYPGHGAPAGPGTAGSSNDSYLLMYREAVRGLAGGALDPHLMRRSRNSPT